MKTTLSEQPYQWQDDSGAWGVGRLVLGVHPDDANCKMIITEQCGTLAVDPMDSESVMVMPSHSHLPVFVEWGRLSPYPASPIPEPSNTGTTSEIA